MNNSPLISIIVPIYNSEAYLHRCVDSILSQSYENIEVLLLDNKSTDNSKEICHEYANLDKRVKTYFVDVPGVSATRNEGINRAQGSYICFVDSDDVIGEDLLLIYVNSLNSSDNSLDLIQASYSYLYQDGNVKEIRKVEAQVLSNKAQIMKAFLLEDIFSSVCGKLFNKDMIGDLRFDESFNIGEDTLFTYSYCKKAKTVKIIDYPGYFYFQSPDSVMGSSLNDKHFQPLGIYRAIIEENKDNIELYKLALRRKIIFSYEIINRILKYQNKEKNKVQTNMPDGNEFATNSTTYLIKLKEYRKEIVGHKLDIFFSSIYPLRYRLSTFLLWICPPLFYRIYSRFLKN